MDIAVVEIPNVRQGVTKLKSFLVLIIAIQIHGLGIVPPDRVMATGN